MVYTIKRAPDSMG